MTDEAMELLRDEERGLYDKYRVERRNDPTKKHKDCEYFVLDLSHDPFSWDALNAYAFACERKFPTLASDLRNKMKQINKESK